MIMQWCLNLPHHQFANFTFITLTFVITKWIFCLGHEYEDTYVHEVEEPSKLEKKKKVNQKNQGNLPGFRVASNSDYKMERYVEKHYIAEVIVMA